jgi:hypothetical protein
VSLGPGFRRDDDWDRALVHLQKAQAALDAAVSEPDQDAYDALLDSHSDALKALLAWEQTGAEDCLEILRRDARRLAASTA